MRMTENVTKIFGTSMGYMGGGGHKNDLRINLKPDRAGSGNDRRP